MPAEGQKRTGLAIRCPVVAKVSPTARGLQVNRVRAATAQDQGLLHLVEATGDRLRRCRHCGAWFWWERKREYCGPPGEGAGGPGRGEPA